MLTKDRSDLPTWLTLLIVGLVIAIVLVAGYIIVQQLQGPSTDAPDAGVAFVQDENFNGIEAIDPARQMPDFTLTGTDGDPISLSDLPEQPTLLFFGFTNCPDICPITLGEMRGIHNELGDIGDDLNYVFISVDGSRDTPERMAQYFTVRDVDSFAVGLTGDSEDVRRVGADYGVKFVYGTPDENGNYGVDHTSSMFLLDADRTWIRKYAFSTERDAIIEDLRQVLGAPAAEA